MSDKHFFGRRVVTGILPSGKEGVISDGAVPVMIETVMGPMRDLWSIDSLPASLDSVPTEGRSFTMLPPPAGLVVRLGQLLPDESWKNADISGMFNAIGGGGSHMDGADVVGLHAKETVDCVTIVSGEVVAILESEEVVLKAGETLIQRGTKHSWSNRGKDPVVMLITIMSAQHTSAEEI